MLKSLTSYDFLIFVSLDYTEFNVLANSNGFVDFYSILYHTSLNDNTCMCKDLVCFINYFEDRNGIYIDEFKKNSNCCRILSAIFMKFNIQHF